MVAGLGFAVVACGGGNKTSDQQSMAGGQDTTATSAPAANAPAAAAPAGTGKTHDVNMELDGSKYKYDPDNLTIKAGDVVRFHNKSGGPHNVSFWPDSIPSGAGDVLKKNMPDQMAPLQSPLETEQDAVYQISFAGAPKATTSSTACRIWPLVCTGS